MFIKILIRSLKVEKEMRRNVKGKIGVHKKQLIVNIAYEDVDLPR